MDLLFDAKRVKSEIVAWIAEYFENNAPPETKAVIGISGGKDSSVVAALCVEAIGRERVIGVLMPQGRQDDIDVSHMLCQKLKIEKIELNIGEAAEALYTQAKTAGYEPNTIAIFNTPARMRMAALYMVSAIVGGRVANTSNFSEDYVGYATKFGDSAGDFSPLSDLTVTEVKAIGREIGLASIFVDKTPLDGLCGRTDEENLGFTYDVLDRYIRVGICEDERIKEKIEDLHKANRHKFIPMAAYRRY
ncbi:MAG: NAD(+) synthase [Oscillospiraceae bacterium]|nr:NAD(+) synthase [Oscillospiraceae bacterium]